MTDELDVAISKYYVEANALVTASAEVGERWGQLAQQDIHIRERFRLKFDELRLKLDELERKLIDTQPRSDTPDNQVRAGSRGRGLASNRATDD